MIDIRFEIDGRPIKPDELGNAVERTVLEQLKTSLNKELEAIRCPVHGQSTTIIARGKSVEDLDIEVTGCCEQFIGAVKSKL